MPKTITNAILSRTSVRKYKNKEVPHHIIKEILNAGRYAPSRGNSQPWHFVVVTDQKQKAKLQQACYNQKLVEDAAFCIVVLGEIDPRETIPDRTAELVREGALEQDVKEFADHVLDDWDLNELKVDAALNSSIPATMMCLSALDYGLGSCWVKLVQDDAVLDVIGAPKGFYHTGVLAFGYPEHTPKPRPRKPLSMIVSCNKFGTKFVD